MGNYSNTSSGWEARLNEIKNIKDNEYLRNARYYFYNGIDYHLIENYNKEDHKEIVNSFFYNLKLIHHKIGHDKNTLKFIDFFHIKMIDLFTLFNLEDGIIFLYNYDSKNKLIYQKYLNINE